jgi:hypothetical protein
MAERFRTQHWRHGMGKKKTSMPVNRHCTIGLDVMGRPAWVNIPWRWREIWPELQHLRIERGGMMTDSTHGGPLPQVIEPDARIQHLTMRVLGKKIVGAKKSGIVIRRNKNERR